MATGVIRKIFFRRRYGEEKCYQFATDPIRARVRSKSEAGADSYLVLDPAFGIKDWGGSTLIASGKLTPVERKMADDQRSVSFQLQTTQSTTAADLHALVKAAKVGLEVELTVAARFRPEVGNLMPMVLAPPDPRQTRLSKPFYATLTSGFTDLDLIEWKMYPVVMDKVGQGYFIANPDPVRAQWNTRVIKDPKAGTCGDFKGLGMAWSEGFLGELFGPGSVLTWIQVGAPLSENTFNHVATLAILPNGDRYVLDYWMSVKTKTPRVFGSLDDWRKAANNEVFELKWAPHLSLYYAEDMDQLSSLVAQYGKEPGISKYEKARADPARAAQIAARRAALVKSYRRKPW